MSGFGGWNSGLRTASQNQGNAAVTQNQADANNLNTQLTGLSSLYGSAVTPSNIAGASTAANNLALTGGYNPVAPVTPTTTGTGYDTYKSFAETGGYTPETSAAFIRNAVAPTQGVYNNAQDQLYRQRALQGGYMPAFDASQNSITAGEAAAGANATLGAETSLQQQINANKLAGAGGETSTLGQQQQYGVQQTGQEIQQSQLEQTGLIAGEQALQNFNQFGASGLTQTDLLGLESRAQNGQLNMSDAQLLEGLAQESPALLQSLIAAVPGILSALTGAGKPTINITNSGGQGGSGGAGGSSGPVTTTNTNTNPTTNTNTATASGGAGGTSTSTSTGAPPTVRPPTAPPPPSPGPGTVTTNPPLPGTGNVPGTTSSPGQPGPVGGQTVTTDNGDGTFTQKTVNSDGTVTTVVTDANGNPIQDQSGNPPPTNVVPPPDNTTPAPVVSAPPDNSTPPPPTVDPTGGPLPNPYFPTPPVAPPGMPPVDTGQNDPNSPNYPGPPSQPDPYAPIDVGYGPGVPAPGGESSTDLNSMLRSIDPSGQLMQTLQQMDPNTLAALGFNPDQILQSSVVGSVYGGGY